MPHTARHGGDDDGEWAGNEDGDSSTDGSDGGVGSATWNAIAPEFLKNNLNLLEAILNNPRRFVIGAVATTLLETMFGVVTRFVEIVLLVFGGSNPGALNAPGETIGLIDVPAAAVDLVISTGSILTRSIVNGIESLNEPVFALASSAGPAAPVIIATVVVIEVIVVLWLLERLILVVADLLQLGGFTQ